MWPNRTESSAGVKRDIFLGFMRNQSFFVWQFDVQLLYSSVVLKSSSGMKSSSSCRRRSWSRRWAWSHVTWIFHFVKFEQWIHRVLLEFNHINPLRINLFLVWPLLCLSRFCSNWVDLLTFASCLSFGSLVVWWDESRIGWAWSLFLIVELSLG